ncbi:MAG: BtpA/SgcQ family protein [Phycisphaerales bacterium]|jgi:membrane complex biogenesis BtpA family protein
MSENVATWCFKDRPAIIGMVHLQALPGTPRSGRSVREIAADAALQAKTLVKAGFRSLLIENMHDAPYVAGPHGPEITATITAAAMAVRDAAPDATIGLQVLARGERVALAVALACGGAFVRCENFVFSHVADEGLMVEASAGPLLRYRREIGAEGVHVFADIKKKHASHAITQDVSLADVVHGAEFFGADGVVITGSATGRSASLDDVEAARKAGPLPVLVGSGVTPANVKAMLRHAHGVIVGSSLKVGGVWNAPLDERACEAFIEACHAAS